MSFNFKPGDLPPYALLPGDPARVPLIAGMWDEAHRVAERREFVLYTGVYKGAPVACCSTGIGCPSTSVAMENLARGGVTTFLRVGTCGALQKDVRVGDIVVFDSAARYDGASKLYAPLEFPAVASHDVTEACIRSGDKLGLRYRVGTTRTADTFFARHPKPGSSFNDFWQSDWSHHFDDLRRLNIIAAEMEASIVFVLSRVWGLRAGGMAVVLDNMLEVAAKERDFDATKDLDHSPEHIERVSKMGCEAIHILHQMDQQRTARTNPNPVDLRSD